MTNTEPTKPDPGVAPFGNFINYYQFNSAAERLKLLPTAASAAEAAADDCNNESAPQLTENFWSQAAASYPENEPYIVLDVGCNAGNFTQLLYADFLRKHTATDGQTSPRPVHVLGIDIDAQLIARAQQFNQHPDNVSYMCLDVMAEGASQQIADYLERIVPGRCTFNAVFCMSLTMWIHLNHGDAGLADFLRTVSALAALLVIEPQPWKCYGTAVRRQRRAAAGGGAPFERFAGLQWRQDIEQQIDTYLVEVCERRRVYRTGPTKWDRRIALYVRTSNEVA